MKVCVLSSVIYIDLCYIPFPHAGTHDIHNYALNPSHMQVLMTSMLLYWVVPLLDYRLSRKQTEH